MNTTTRSSPWQFLRRRKRQVFFVVLIMVCFFITANVCLYHRSTCLTVAELWLTPAARNISVNVVRVDSEDDPTSLKIQMTFVNKSEDTVFLLRGHRHEYRFINVRTPWGMAVPHVEAVANDRSNSSPWGSRYGLRMEPGESVTISRDLRKLFYFDAPGTYTFSDARMFSIVRNGQHYQRICHIAPLNIEVNAQ